MVTGPHISVSLSSDRLDKLRIEPSFKLWFTRQVVNLDCALRYIFTRNDDAYGSKMLPSAEFVFVWDTCGPVTQKNVHFNDRQYADQRSQDNHLIQSVGVDFFYCVSIRGGHREDCMSAHAYLVVLATRGPLFWVHLIILWSESETVLIVHASS